MGETAEGRRGAAHTPQSSREKTAPVAPLAEGERLQTQGLHHQQLSYESSCSTVLWKCQEQPRRSVAAQT